VPTVSNVVRRITPTDSHDCLRSCLRYSTWTRIHPPTSSLYISLFIFTASVIRHPFFRPPHLALNINVQLVTSTRTRRRRLLFRTQSIHRIQAIAMYPTSLLGYSLSCAIQYLILIVSIYCLSSTPPLPSFLSSRLLRPHFVHSPWILHVYGTWCIYCTLGLRRVSSNQNLDCVYQ